MVGVLFCFFSLGRDDFPLFLNTADQLYVFVSSAVMKEQPMCAECAAGQVVAVSSLVA